MKQKLPDLRTVKKTLYTTWSLKVKQADGWRCALCGDTDRLAAHHWYCCDKQAHAARYVVDNGVTLCFACHLRKVHLRADYAIVSKLYRYMIDCRSFEPWFINARMTVDLTTPVLRRLWDDMREDVTDLVPLGGSFTTRGGKSFIHLPSISHQLFAPHNVVVNGNTKYEVMVVATMKDKTYRYTLKELNDDCD